MFVVTYHRFSSREQEFQWRVEQSGDQPINHGAIWLALISLSRWRHPGGHWSMPLFGMQSSFEQVSLEKRSERRLAKSQVKTTVEFAPVRSAQEL
ncbi:hypothetical protein GUJ93_ZPchr0011g28483 [Zizania palustris]|uniref:Uncharacterized protein n=1 Tax=Zizania palustris TaxID=103762 RepID=A0A8J5WHR5_ZIZPA|nr:hypothetical protein GUJ93_ZPchr0011g28483 [Zizania palustris]